MPWIISLCLGAFAQSGVLASAEPGLANPAPAALAPTEHALQEPAVPELPYDPVQTKFPVEYHFVRALEPDPGIADLEQCFGRPTLVLYWRYDDKQAVERLKALLGSLGTRAEHLWVLALERSPTDLPDYERLLWNNGLLQSPALFGREEAIPRRFQNPAQWMLLSEVGKVVASQAWGEDSAGLLSALDQALERAHHPVEVVDKKLLESWGEFRTGKWDRAYSSGVRARDKARERLAKKPTDPEALAISIQAGTLALEIEAEAARQGARCRLLVERQDYAQAKALLVGLQARRPKDSKEIDYLLTELEALFSAKGVREGLEAAERYRPLEAKLHLDGVSAHRAELVAFIAKYPEGFYARRAKRLLELFPE